MFLVLFFGLVAFLCFWPFHFARNTPFWERLMDACHLPLFGTIALVLRGCIPSGGSRDVKHLSLVALLAALLAGAVEIIQPLTGRTESLDDFCNGVIGIGLAMTGAELWRRQVRWPARAGFGFIVVLAVVFVLSPAFAEWKGIQWRRANFPLLGDFETQSELKLWTPQGDGAGSSTRIRVVSQNVSRGRQALRVETAAAEWAGISYAAGDTDWGAFGALCFDIYNPGGPFRMVLRVDDDGDCSSFAGRYNHELELQNGWTHNRVSMQDLAHGPKTRVLNIHAVRRLVLFSAQAEESRIFFLDNVRLE